MLQKQQIIHNTKFQKLWAETLVWIWNQQHRRKIPLKHFQEFHYKFRPLRHCTRNTTLQVKAKAVAPREVSIGNNTYSILHFLFNGIIETLSSLPFSTRCCCSTSQSSISSVSSVLNCERCDRNENICVNLGKMFAVIFGCLLWSLGELLWWWSMGEKKVWFVELKFEKKSCGAVNKSWGLFKIFLFGLQLLLC